MGKRDRDRIHGALRTALVHLLKWQFQPEARSNAWRAAVVKGRERIAKLLEDSPSLQDYRADQLSRAYAAARRIAEAETELVGLPEACPWPVEQVPKSRVLAAAAVTRFDLEAAPAAHGAAAAEARAD